MVKHWAKIGVRVDAQRPRAGVPHPAHPAGEHDASGWHVDRELERAAYTYGWSGIEARAGRRLRWSYAQGWLDWFARTASSGT